MIGQRREPENSYRSNDDAPPLKRAYFSSSVASRPRARGFVLYSFGATLHVSHRDEERVVCCTSQTTVKLKRYRLAGSTPAASNRGTNELQSGDRPMV